jgi:hypothetical protein
MIGNVAYEEGLRPTRFRIMLDGASWKWDNHGTDTRSGRKATLLDWLFA